MKKVKLILILIITALSFLNLNLAAQPSFPRTYVMWYLPTLSMETAKTLVGYDQFIGDPEVFGQSADAIKWLREQNPEMEFYCYFNPVEWFDPMFSDKPWSLKMVEFLNTKPAWWLKGTNGERISFWTGMNTMNCAIDCKKYSINGTRQNYLEYTTGEFIKLLRKYPYLKGVLIDNLWSEVSWLGNYGKNIWGIDRDEDGKNDDPFELNLAWRRGLDYCINKLRSYGGSEFIIIGNPGNLDYTKCNGKQFENFPEIYLDEKDEKYEAWYKNLNHANYLKGPNFFNARADNYFFTLCSAALLDNASFSYLQNTPYDPKYKLNLGTPLRDADSAGEIVSRKFKNGELFVNPSLKTAWVKYKNGTIRRE